MDIRQLRYLVTVVHERSVSRAAERLAMTQPPLSAAIAQLERELGVPLLERHPRGVEPTEAGRYLIEQATQILESMEAAAATVRAVGTGRRGRLTIAASPAIAQDLLPAVLGQFDETSPEVTTEIHDAADPDVVTRVRDRDSDVGLVYCANAAELDRLTRRDLDVALIRREPLVAVVHERPASPILEHLADERWILPTAHPGFPGLGDVVERAWARAALHPQSRRHVASPVTAIRLAVTTRAVTLVPSSLTSFAEGLGAHVLPLSDPLTSVEAAVLWRRHERRSPVLAHFLRAALWTREPDRLEPAHRTGPSDG
ncbi:LysR family transcriptional regulator [Winogradskya humida]|uniref:Transcriptional regulator n=1 Tax=Winogradskya humida TaxID=113566 RepID=A0ABQ3ZYY0_9ACTN|nr:LysR family transcriptional regulator [Actinoplanes humidus]GIE23826.1 transcriptional regulator [Actinoplanes humidus]